MITKSSLIFIIDDDLSYGNLVEQNLLNQNFENIVLFTTEKECLENMVKKPKVLMSDYHLKNTTGFKLIQKAREIYPDFYTILFSADYDYVNHKDVLTSRQVNKYIFKDVNTVQEMLDTLNQWMRSDQFLQYY
jgi:DNA-binding NtrC family response regulator